MKRTSRLFPKSWLMRTIWIVVLATTIVALVLFGLGDASETPTAAEQRTVWWLESPTTSVNEGYGFYVYLKRDPKPSHVGRGY